MLIKGEKFFGSFDNVEDAYQAALNELGNVPVLIKKVTAEEETEELPALTVGILNSSI